MKSAIAWPITLIGLLLLLAGCGDEPAAPPPPTLDDLSLQLEVTPASPLISEAVTARVSITGGDPSILSGALVSWGWTGEYTYLFDDLNRTELQFQFFATGPQQVRARLTKDGHERLLTQTVTVQAGGGDGSLDMLAIGAGAFLRGDDVSAFSLQTPQRTIELSAFSLARTEMTNFTLAGIANWAVGRGQVGVPPTNTQFLVWTPVAGGQPLIVVDLSLSDLYWNGSGVSILPGRETLPATGVHWAGAAALCNWLSEKEGFDACYTFTPSNPLHLYTVSCDFARNGYRLPTEAEWEKAARGGATLPSGSNPNPVRQFPWGDAALHFRIDENLDGDPDYPMEIFGSLRANTRAPLNAGRPFDGPIFGGALPVGSFPAGRGPYGQDDLIGNVAEWCNDWFGFGYYTDSPSVDPHGPDTVLPSIDDFKSFRGDSWYGSFIPGLNAFSVEEGGSKRRWATYHFAANFLGFRVARSLGS
jgi:formylglycine-generating enzyme required for sulfatase activity